MSDPIESGLENTDSQVEEVTSPAPQETEAPASFFDSTPFYEKLPSQYKESGVLDPIFEQYENKYKEAISKFTPYEPFIEVPADQLASAWNLFQAIDTEEGARKIYDGIAEVLGITPAQAEQVVKEELKDQGLPDPEEETPEQREIRELKANQEGFNAYLQKEVHNQAVAQNSDVIDKSLLKVYEADPSLKSDRVRQEDLMQRVYDLNEINHGTVSLDKLMAQAHKQQREYNQHLYDTYAAQNNTTQRSAPFVMAPSGSNPGSGVDPATRGESERKSAMAEALRAATAHNV
jgi:hypothetical protein